MVFLGCNNPQKDITKKDKLNVLFIISDDLNCDLGIYGNKIVKTPTFKQLQKDLLLVLGASVFFAPLIKIMNLVFEQVMNFIY